MSAQRFIAANATDALRRIKAELGGDAVVLSSTEVEGGVEIVAIAAAELVTLTPPDTTPVAPSSLAARAARDEVKPAAEGGDRAWRLLGERARREVIEAAPVLRRSVEPWPQSRDSLAQPSREEARERLQAEGRRRPSAEGAEPMPTAAMAQDGREIRRELPRNELPIQDVSPAAPPPPQAMAPVPVATGPGLHALSSQMAEVKSLLSGHLAQNFWTSLQQTAPSHALLTRRLLNAGLSSQIVSQMLAELPLDNDFERLLDGAQRWVQSHLQIQDPFALFDTGGVYAFIGPTGVGKTTTLAKIAARCVLRYGRRQVALLTTDTYRIGAQEQLRVFARILNLPVVSLRDSDDLESKVADLSSRKIVLLDTAGVGQRDTMMVEQLEMIRQGYGAVHRVLVMSATTSTRTLDDVVESHQNALGGQGIHSAILTKIDEGMSLAPSVDCVLRHQLPLLFLSNGQRVPEDLFAADAAYIAHRTVNPRGRDDSSTDAAHIPAMIADDISGWTSESRTA
jgi:flagellar biosynthesis protein FlhF